MARRPPPWHWLRVARLHAPHSPNLRAVLFAIAARMDQTGVAFPSQKQIADDIGLSERTVRPAVLDARRSSWLAVVERVRPGKAWRLSHYIACIPDHIDLGTIDLGASVDLPAIAEKWLHAHGLIDDDLHGQAPLRVAKRRPKGAASNAARSPQGAESIAAASRSVTGADRPPIQTEGAANFVHEVRQSESAGAANSAQGAEIYGTKVRQASPTKVQGKGPEKISGEVNTHEGRARTMRVPEPPKPKTKTATEIRRAVAALREVDPDMPIDQLARVAHVSEAEARAALEPERVTA